MKNSTLLSYIFYLVLLCACTTQTISPTPTTLPHLTATAETCTEQGTIGSDHVPNPTQGFDNIHFEYYLPPCYDSAKQTRYPVFYLMTLTDEHSLSPTDNTPMSLAERLIQAGKMPPTIIIVPAQLIGYGSDAALTKDLVPYVDGKFRTIRDRKQRATGGISNGAAVAVRMAFQFPDTFSSVGLLSGGLANGESERFVGWINRTPPDHWPRVKIDVGDHDGIMPLTQNLMTTLDIHHVPYTVNIGKGDHNWTFWSAQMESYLLWLANGG